MLIIPTNQTILIHNLNLDKKNIDPIKEINKKKTKLHNFSKVVTKLRLRRREDQPT